MSTRRFTLALGLVIASVVGCTANTDERERGTESTVDPSVMGLAINARYDEQTPSQEDLRRIGARWVRTLLYADDPEKTISALANYRCLGVRSLVLFNQQSFAPTGSPPGDDDDAGWETYASVFADEVATFVASHKKNIDAVEVWNEPDLPTGGNIPPRRFGLLLYKTYPKVKAVADVPVIAGAVAGSTWPTYLSDTAAWLNPRGTYFDAGGVHPYGQRASGYPSGYGFGELEAVVREAHSRWNTGKSSKKPIWVSEFGLPIESGDPAIYLQKAYAIFEKLRGEGVAQRAFWFAWDDRTHYDPGSERFGLVETSGSPRTLRASGTAFVKLAGPLTACDSSSPSPPPDSPPPTPTPTDPITVCYERNGGASAVGTPFDNGGGAGVHRWGPGSVQDFHGGSLGPNLCMIEDAHTTAWMVRGAIRDAFMSSGGAEGFLGYPIEDEHDVSGIPLQKFEGGYVTHVDGSWKAIAGAPTPPSTTPPPAPAGCPCLAGSDNFCLYGASYAGCPMTAPGGYCDPDGNGDFGDADWVRGWNEHKKQCG